MIFVSFSEKVTCMKVMDQKLSKGFGTLVINMLINPMGLMITVLDISVKVLQTGLITHVPRKECPFVKQALTQMVSKEYSFSCFRGLNLFSYS